MATMNPIFNEYMKAKKFSPNSVRAYTRNINQCLNFIGKPDNEITSIDMLAWQNSLDGLSTSSVAQKLSAVRTYFGFLKHYGMIDSVPSAELETPEVVNKEKHHMDKQMINDMMDACKDAEMRAIVYLFAKSGMRVSELTNITVTQYQMMRKSGENHIYIVSKNKKSEPVFFSDKTCRLIDEYLKVRGVCNAEKDYLFLSSWGNKVSRNILSSKLKTVAKEAGIPWWNEMNNHQLRVGSATILADEGIPVPQIQKFLRHANIETTMSHYIKVSEKTVQNAVMNTDF